MNHPEGLPDNWEVAPLGEVASFTRGITFPGSAKSRVEGEGLIPCLRTANVQEKVDWDDLIYVPESFVKRPDRLIRANDILISMANSLELVGKVALIDAGPRRSTFGGFISAVRPQARIVPKFLFYILRSNELQKGMRRTASRSVNIANLALSRIGDLTVPVPPLPEQQRIVEKIERLLEQSRTAREALDRIPPLLKRFRQSVLAKAFRGELTERDPNDEPASVLLEHIRQERRRKWEEDLRAKGKDPRKAKYVEPEPPDTSGLPELPEGWMWATLDTIAEVRSGVAKGRHLSGTDIIEIPYLRVANVQSGYLDLREVKRIQIKRSELDRYGLVPGDVLFTEGGDRDKLGRGTVWQGQVNPCVHQNHIHCARPRTPDVSSHFISLSAQLPSARDYFWSVASQTVNLASVNASNLRAYFIPLPPAGEQRRIVAKIEGSFAHADAIEQAVVRVRCKAEHVDQAVLARTFRGEL